MTIPACGAAPPSPQAVAESRSPAPGARSPAPAPALAIAKSCSEPTTAPAAPRDAGIDAYLAGRLTEAASRLEEAVRADPRDRAAEALRGASLARLTARQARASEEISASRPVALEPIPLARALRRTIEGVPASKVHLEKVSEAKNLITDGADWVKNNDLPPGVRRFGGLLPSHVGERLSGRGLNSAFVHADHVAATYGSRIVISGQGKRPLVFDAAAATHSGPRPFEIVFAQLAGSTLVVALAYNGYARESGGKNGYVAAYDAATGALAWSSDPLVANASEIVVRGGSIVTGYGFTAEPDFLFVLDLATGAIDQKVPVKTGPESIRQKDDRLFVRTYDVDYVYKSVTGIPPGWTAALAATEAAPDPLLDGEARCWLRRATAAISARDASALREAAGRLDARARDPELAAALRAEEERLSSPGRIDPSIAPLVIVPSPPWKAAAPGASRAPSAPPPKLVRLASRPPATPPMNANTSLGPWDGDPSPDANGAWFIAPVAGGRLPPGVRPDTPSTYGMEPLRAVIPEQGASGGPRTILLYGGRYLALVRGDVTERVFDLDAFRHPPKADPVWKEFAEQDATYAQERDGVLYVCNGGGSYAKEVYGKKGFLSALEAATGRLLWRSAPLTCAGSFAVAGDHLVSGYGFTAEPDFVFLVRRSDGAIVQKVSVPSAPSAISLDGRIVHVETYSGAVDFELR